MGLLDSILSALGLRRRQPAGSDAPQDGEGGEELVSEERDPELEAQDDAGSFDFEGDIARYFTAEFRIETAWDNHERREVLFEEYQVRGTKHWYQIKATFERWLETPAAKSMYRTPGDLMQARMTTTQTMTLDDLDLESNRKAEGEEVALDPVEGVSLERWARAEAALAGGAKLADILDGLELDEDAWAKASEVWNERMERDASAKIASEYSKHVGKAGAGKFAAKGKPK
jgi:hypothetical protein